ncbi:MAG: V-type ATP synthase subunit C [Nitrospinae bacterium]|nr:V-type ATP synthase subunit C [Nitrospinota bacterium]
MKWDSRYLSAVGNIRVLEKRIMGRPAMVRLLEARSEDEMCRVLGDYGYGEFLDDGSSIHDFESILSAHLRRSYELIEKMSAGRLIARISRRRYDFHNLKALLKADLLGEDPEPSLSTLGEIPVSRMKDVLSGKAKEISPELDVVVRDVKAYLENESSPQVVDLLVDKAYIDYISKMGSEIGIQFFDRLVSKQVDLTNIKTLMRIRKMESNRKLLVDALLPGGEIDNAVLLRLYDRSNEDILSALRRTSYASIANAGGGEWLHKGDISKLEHLSDNFILGYLGQARIVTSGPEPLLSYLMQKDKEIKILRIILVGKINSIPLDLIRERLTVFYG